MEVTSIEKALVELRKDENKRKFIQTFDLIVNLKDFDVRKESVNIFITLPNSSEKKICAFLEKKVEGVEVITKEGFKKYDSPKEIKRLAKKYDFFIASAPLMSLIATQFGRVFGPAGKMPSPQAGIVAQEKPEMIKAEIEKMKKMIKIRTKEKSIKISIGKEDMQDLELKDNIESAISSLEKVLPKGKDNVKNILIKLTMSKPVRVR